MGTSPLLTCAIIHQDGAEMRISSPRLCAVFDELKREGRHEQSDMGTGLQHKGCNSDILSHTVMRLTFDSVVCLASHLSKWSVVDKDFPVAPNACQVLGKVYD